MIDDKMQYIDDFFEGRMSGDEISRFEEKINSDPSFAADVAFYLSSKQVAREMAAEEKKKRFKELYTSTNGHDVEVKTGKVRQIRYAMYSALAAAVITAILWIAIRSNNSPTDYANRYIKDHHSMISVTMGKEGEIQKAADLYNKGQYTAALTAFENIIGKDSTLFYPLEYAGLAALRIPDYEKALRYFSRLEKFHAYSNPAVILQAITLMKRNQPGDKQEAKALLKKVADQNLDGKEDAENLLKKID